MSLEREILSVIWPEIEERVGEMIARHMGRAVSPWMTTDEAAHYLRTTSAAVRQRAQRGTIPAHKDDAGRWLFHREEVDAALLIQEVM